jgi:hypothetical protein
MILGGFLAILLYRCITNETVKVESYLEKTNRVKDTSRRLILTKDNFEVSLYLGYVGKDKTILPNID